jgi:hypothetical protein
MARFFGQSARRSTKNIGVKRQVGLHKRKKTFFFPVAVAPLFE